jgi:hypothetical protein
MDSINLRSFQEFTMHKPNRIEILIRKIYKNNPKHIAEFGIASMLGMIAVVICLLLYPEHTMSLVSIAFWIAATFLFVFTIPPVRMIKNHNHKKLAHLANIYFVIVVLISSHILPI